MWEAWVQSLDWEDTLEKGMATHSSILAWEFYTQKRLAGYSPRGRKEVDTTVRLTLLTELTWFDWRWNYSASPNTASYLSGSAAAPLC